MTNSEFLEKFVKLQYKVGYDKSFDAGNSKIVYSETDDSIFSNYALVQTGINQENLTNIEKCFKSLNRTSVVYFENSPKSNMLLKFITDNGYSKAGEDSWMFYQDIKIDESRFVEVKKVENETDLKIFLDTFDLSYQKDDPNNPYGDVKGFIPSCRKAWLEFGNTNRLQYFIAYKDDEPVATSILNSFDKLGYISCVGSVRKVRGEGFGKLATLYAVNQSKLLGNSEHCLATEEGTYPNEFYKRIGFKTRFTTLVYSKK